MRETVDVAVVGAGPAGLSCAAELGAGLAVALVDAGHGVGGQYWRQPVAETPTQRLYHDLETFDSLRDRVAASGTAVLLQHHVWAVVPDGEGYAVHVLDRSGGPGAERAVTLPARAVVIATGAYDRALPFPGWDLPGVMTVGGIQALLKAGGVSAGRRVALGGTGPFLLPVAVGLAEHGSRVVGVHESSSPRRWLPHAATLARNPAKLREGAAYAAVLARHGVPVRPRTMIVAAHGRDRVEAVSVAWLDPDGRLLPGAPRTIEADAVGVGWGFAPQLDLALTLGCVTTTDASGVAVVDVDELGRTSRAAVYAAGEPCGVGGAALAVVQGRLAAAAVRSDLVGRGSAAPQDLRTARRLRGFATAMHRAHPVPPAWSDVLEPSTTLCRCEEVSCGRVRAAVAAGADSARQVKQLTRAGMGWCQGRVCGLAAGLLCGEGPGVATERLVAAPVPLGVLARRTDQ